MFNRGDVVRYASGPTALMMMITPWREAVSDSGRYYAGLHVMGGWQNAYECDLKKASRADEDKWIECRGVEPSFDLVSLDFTTTLAELAGWRHAYFGAAHKSRIRRALGDLRALVARTEANLDMESDAVKRVKAFLRYRRDLKGYDDSIYRYNAGHETEVELKQTDLETILMGAETT